MNIRIIVNPISGTEAARKRAKKAVKSLEEEFKIKAVKTEYASHATILTQEAVKEGADIVVAVGGDGTVNEIASALVGTDTALYIVPTGSGNGLARDLGMFGLSNKQIIERIHKNQPYKIDCGEVLGRKFFCTCGSGFDAYIGHLFAETKVRGFLTYIKLSLSAYKNYTPLTYDFSFTSSKSTGDSTETYIRETAFVANIANNKQFGNNAYIAPMANMQDGLFTVTIIKPFKWYHIPHMAYSLFFKRMHKNKFVKTFDCGDCTLTLPKGASLHIDGEPIKTNADRVNIKMIPSALKVL